MVGAVARDSVLPSRRKRKVLVADKRRFGIDRCRRPGSICTQAVTCIIARVRDSGAKPLVVGKRAQCTGCAAVCFFVLPNLDPHGPCHGLALPPQFGPKSAVFTLIMWHQLAIGNNGKYYSSQDQDTQAQAVLLAIYPTRGRSVAPVMKLETNIIMGVPVVVVFSPSSGE